jgi:hypothetical protein
MRLSDEFPYKGNPDLHGKAISEAVASDVRRKYSLGAKEHGGFLWEKPNLPNLHAEIIDLIAYYYTLRGRLKVILSSLEENTREGHNRAISMLHEELGGQVPHQVDGEKYE